MHTSAAYLTAAQVREVDRRAVAEFGLGSLVLMENAGRGVADRLCQLIGNLPSAAAVAICCGVGNNGGDGFVVARHLDLRGLAVRVLVWGDLQRMTPDAAANLHILQRSGIPIELLGTHAEPDRTAELLHGATWIVDALLGTGTRGQPRPPLNGVIDQLNAQDARRLAIDLPSGLDADSGTPSDHTIRADQTCTFVARKAGFRNPAAAAYLGEVRVLDIGAPRRLIASVLDAAS